MADRFQTTSPSLSGPATHAFAISPNDTTPVSETTRALYIGVGGNLSVTMASGGNTTFTAIASGTLLPIRVTKILATGTTATDIVGLV
ncbi:spike base protein, RCAP_Rcc01079 family [Rhizobium alvei]|uniref:Uncharacterized protein n=1 Tax=Rhizobium alvei TaxID=1132659 RepID=A0ABT8YPQ7_9HYPH|nr:hypothetical protein [Rhizobium alvei]MDO6965511.1 hypothetical protein [Rhizobium alvei]